MTSLQVCPQVYTGDIHRSTSQLRCIVYRSCCALVKLLDLTHRFRFLVVSFVRLQSELNTPSRLLTARGYGQYDTSFGILQKDALYSVERLGLVG